MLIQDDESSLSRWFKEVISLRNTWNKVLKSWKKFYILKDWYWTTKVTWKKVQGSLTELNDESVKTPIELNLTCWKKFEDKKSLRNLG